MCATYMVLLTHSSIGSTLFVYLCLSVGTCSCMCVRQLFVLPTTKGIDSCGVGNEDLFPVVTLLVVTRITRAHSDIAQCTVGLYRTYLAFMATLCVCEVCREERSITFYDSGDRLVWWPGFIVFHFRSYCRVCRCGVLGYLRNFGF